MEVAGLGCGWQGLSDLVEALDPEPFLKFLTLPKRRQVVFLFKYFNWRLNSLSLGWLISQSDLLKLSLLGEAPEGLPKPFVLEIIELRSLVFSRGSSIFRPSPNQEVQKHGWCKTLRIWPPENDVDSKEIYVWFWGLMQVEFSFQPVTLSTCPTPCATLTPVLRSSLDSPELVLFVTRRKLPSCL